MLILPVEERQPEGEVKIAEESKTDDMKVEEEAVVLALRDSFIPGLKGSNAIMFATLLADLFPGINLPTVFESFGVRDGKTAMNELVYNLDEVTPTVQRSQEMPSVEQEGENKSCVYIHCKHILS